MFLLHMLLLLLIFPCISGYVKELAKKCLVNERFENKDAFFSGPANIYNYAHEWWHGSLVFTRKLLIVNNPIHYKASDSKVLYTFIIWHTSIAHMHAQKWSLRQLHMGHVSPWLPTEHVKIAKPTKQFFSSVMTDWQQTNRLFGGKKTPQDSIPAKQMSFLTGSKLNEHSKKPTSPHACIIAWCAALHAVAHCFPLVSENSIFNQIFRESSGINFAWFCRFWSI